jgi:CheY-like chemotaxis protein
VLIVDGDRVSERAIELALAPTQYQVEWARDGAAALEILRSTRVDVVVADSLLVDMPGTTLIRRTREAIGPGAPAFLFVSADRTATTRVGLLLQGARDYLVKPFLAEELRIRIQNTVEERIALRVAAVGGVAGLAGDCEHVSVPDLLTMLELARRSGTVAVSVGPAAGRLVVSQGRVVHAEIGNLVGEDAFFVMLQFHGGLFRFVPGECGGPRTLSARVSELLLESAVREDTARHERVDEAALQRTAASLRELGIVKMPIELRGRAPEPAGDPSSARAVGRLAVAVSDPLLLGDLALGPDAPREADTLRLELWAPIADGASQLLALASPPGFHVLAAALGAAPRRLHLRFDAGGWAAVITLVDTEAHDPVPAVAPDGIIVAPSRGELITLAPERLAELTARIAAGGPLALVGLGGLALRATLVRLMEEAGLRARFLGLPRALDDEPRDTVCRLLRLCAGASQADRAPP